MTKTTVTFFDESPSGDRRAVLRLDGVAPEITLRELIRRRVFDEVREHNAGQMKVFYGLVEPLDAERELNGYKLRAPRRIDFDQQFEKAIEAFRDKGIRVAIDDRPVLDLDEPLTLKADSEVSIRKLAPLVAG
jgi:hypothetical protein